jgi:hypothetical protein
MRNFIAPPYFENGNPLNAYGVNQIIEATNALESEFMDFKMLRPKILMKPALKSLSADGNKNGFVLLKNFSHLRVAGTSGGSGTLSVYLRRTGQSDVAIGSGSLSNFDIRIHLNALSNPPNAGEVYLIYLTSNDNNADVTVNYLYEYNAAALTKIVMPTITSSIVIDKTYLNKFVDNIRQLPDVAPCNAPFRGVGGRVNFSGANLINQFAKWEGVRLNNFLRMRFVTDKPSAENLVLRFKIVYDSISYNIGAYSSNTTKNKYDYLLNFTTRAWTITNASNSQVVDSDTADDGIQSIPKGSFYEFKVEGETSVSSSSNKIYIDYVLESKNPL